jgi:hypothetical protein
VFFFVSGTVGMTKANQGVFSPFGVVIESVGANQKGVYEKSIHRSEIIERICSKGIKLKSCRA